MEVNQASQGSWGGVASAPSRERLAGMRWRQEFERMNADALAETKVIHHAPVVGPSELPATELGGKVRPMQRDLYVHPDSGGKTAPIERYSNAAQLVGEQDAADPGGRFPKASVEGLLVVQEDGAASLIAPEVVEPIIEERLRAVLRDAQSPSAYWGKKNVHCELTKEGLIVWVRNADINTDMECQLARRLSNELESCGLHPIRIYLNGRPSYAGGTGHQTGYQSMIQQMET